MKAINAHSNHYEYPSLSLSDTVLCESVSDRGGRAGLGPENRVSSRGAVIRWGFRAVKFTLHTRDLLSTVLYILNSCSLSVEHVQSSNSTAHPQPLKEAKGVPDRPIKWDKSYYSFTGFKNPDEDLEQVSRAETTLTSWLDNNGKRAVKKLENSLPLRKELDRLKDGLSQQLRLSDIRWQRSWGIAHRCSQLQSLGRLAQQNLETLKNAKGRTVIFTDRSGMSAVGHVMLGTMDVHHHWTKLFERLPSYFDLQRKLMFLEDQISYLLGGIQVVYIEELQPVLTLEEYYSLLDVFYNRLLKSRIPFHPRSLRGLQMILHSDRYAPSLHDLGHFNIPTFCDLANLRWFVLTKAQQARENMKRKDELKIIESELIQASTKQFSLEKFYKDPSISSVQMVDCCQRLLGRPLPRLQGMHLCVSRFYSVLQDGDLCIPWNWKNGKATK
ncbi:T-cell activation inhibitor, mitochondrial isoform X2 [Sturnira hondurensis]|uniref:T-cell activation inhibitor, mitochondrial isoform X2 n=1 Tax=Sturnira hondurensis TaxID=192404 RepID=UPI00187A3354|nr:T-cell activation inhibitor, mitochondrial isoform X2 [Sturnira hondurensis]